jgi:EAL domain-containing protein (putative c-di-GMP-specific phosphodiesterase class I)
VSEHGFRKVLEDGAFDIAFHPIVHTGSGAIHHYEALARFPGTIAAESPLKLIAYAEEAGLIAKFDLAMAQKVMDWLKVHGNSYRIAVNISGFSIGNVDYLTELRALLDANPWSKGALMFEITESTRIPDLAAANRLFQALRDQGYEICLDDFGAGVASFHYLLSLDVDVVKFDGSAVKSALIAKKGRAFLSALARLCADIGVPTIAERVDDHETLTFVRECGVDYAQGYLFGEPSADIESFKRIA